jgi:hypothetical protein
MKDNNFLMLLALVVVIMGGVLIISGVKQVKPFKKPIGGMGQEVINIQESSPSGEEVNYEVNFNKIGHIVENLAGGEEGRLYLVYEEPGKPGLKVKLAFEGVSRCLTEGKESPCNPWPQSGSRAKVVGIEGNGEVMVRSLEIIKDGE